MEAYTREAIKLGSWFPSGPLFVSFQRPEKSRSDRNLLNRLKSELFSSPLPRAPFSASFFVASLPPLFNLHALRPLYFSFRSPFVSSSLSSSPPPPRRSYLRPILRTRDFKFVRGGVARFAHRESRLTSPGDQRNVKSVRTKFHRRPVFVSLVRNEFQGERNSCRSWSCTREVRSISAGVLRTYVSSLWLVSWKNVCS